MQDDCERVVWDTCVIIDAIQKTPGRYEKIEPYVEEAQKGKLQIIVSEVSVAELLWVPTGTLEPPKQVQLIKDWLENPYIVRRAVHPGISEKAAEIGRVHKFHSATDAIIVATAVFEKVPVLYTMDGMREGSKKTKRLRLLPLDGQIGVPPLRILIPDPSRGTLFHKPDNTVKETPKEE